MIANKVCPVVLRRAGASMDILAFEHPLAGHQLVKGTIEAGESVEAACLRELAEESGIVQARVVGSLGIWPSSFNEQVWAFLECQPDHALPETWMHHAPDDGGHTFRFFWYPLAAPADPVLWHPLFRDAMGFIQAAVASKAFF